MKALGLWITGGILLAGAAGIYSKIYSTQEEVITYAVSCYAGTDWTKRAWAEGVFSKLMDEMLSKRGMARWEAYYLIRKYCNTPVIIASYLVQCVDMKSEKCN